MIPRAAARLVGWTVPALLAILARAEVPIDVAANPPPGAPGLQESLDRARAIRSARPGEGVTLVLADGVHRLDIPLTFGPGDSRITLAAAPGARPVLSGAVDVTGWEPLPGRPGAWHAPSPARLEGRATPRQLFINGARAIPARIPNEGHRMSRGPLTGTTPIHLPFHPGDLQPAWAGRASVGMYMKWTQLHLPLGDIDGDAGVARLDGGPRSAWMDSPEERYWIEGVPEALDAPGEWQRDPDSGRFLLIPPTGIDPRTASVTVPALDVLVLWEGTAERPVREVTLRGLTFAGTECGFPSPGRIDPQAASQTPGALRARYAVGCRVEDCLFDGLGGYGLEMGRGCQDWRVVGNEFRDLGAGGIRIGEPGDREPDPAAACHSHHFTDNHLHRLGRILAPAVGVLVFQSGTNRIAHNHIHDLYYTAISVGWTWGYQASPCRGNVIEFNHVHDIGQGLLSDMGGIYLLGPQPGTVVRNNVFHDIRSRQYGGWGLYTDEGSTGILLENNVAYRCLDAGFHQHYGRDNVVRNNLLAWNSRHSVMRTRDEPHRSFEFTRNVVLADSGTLLGSNWNGTPDRFTTDHNLWFDARHGASVDAYRFAGGTWEEWRQRGHDRHSVIADPLLVDPLRPERGLRPDSPAFGIGFQPIDLSRLGPRPPGERD